MSARRIRRTVGFVALALLLALALFVGKRWYTLHAAAARRHDGLAAAEAVPPHAATIRAASLPPGEPAPAPALPPERATQWLARADAVVARKRERQFGTQDARLALLPPAQAWQQLTARADDGDVAAAALAVGLALECNGLRAAPPVAHRPESTRKDLSPAWRDWVHAVDRESDRRHTARAAACANVGGGLAFASLMLDRFLQSDDADALLSMAEDIEDDAEAIARLRELAERFGTAAARRALGERLLGSFDPMQSAEGLRLLSSLVPGDESIAAFLADCYRNGCDGFRADRAAGAEWLERAAGDGDLAALEWTIGDALRAEDLVAAWAWAMYRLQLAEHACFEESAPNSVWLQQSAATALALDARLTPEQRTAALHRLDALGQRWLAAAETRLDCRS